MQQRSGSIDFYPNGGLRHPGCGVSVPTHIITEVKDICDHARSWQFYQASVRFPYAFPAVRCNSWDDFASNETCFFNEPNVYMGFATPIDATGKYFLRTGGNYFNMSEGPEGTRPRKLDQSILSSPIHPVTMSDLPAVLRSKVLF
jgi:Lipase